MAALFIFHTGYVRYHLLTEVHHDVLGADAAAVAVHHHDHDDDGDHHDTDHHKPHSAYDHLLQLLTKHQSSLLAVYFVASESSIHLTRPAALVVSILAERVEVPGESPPDPRQPRGPPIV